MTKPLPAGTVNLTVNVTIEERRLLGRLSTLRDESLSDFIRDALDGHMSRICPTTGNRLRGIRRGITVPEIVLTVVVGALVGLICALSQPKEPSLIAGGNPIDGVEVRR